MRVMQFMAGAHHGGAETFFERLAAALARAGLEQRVAIRRDADRGVRLRAAGLDPVQIPFRLPFGIDVRRRLSREIAAFKPDVVLTWMSRAARLCPRGRFVHVGRLGGYYDLKYFRGCDHLIGISRDIVRHIVAGGWPAGRAHYIPNFAPEGGATPMARDVLATPADVPLLLAIGRLHPNKALDALLSALARVPLAWLWIAGDGSERAALEAQAAREGVADRVRFLGWREDVQPLLAAADIVVFPSRHEPFGTVMLEAWAHRKALVAAASFGPREVVTDGTDGLLVPVDDVAALAGAIARLIADPELRSRLARAGRASYEREYAEPIVVRRYLDLFAAVLS